VAGANFGQADDAAAGEQHLAARYDDRRRRVGRRAHETQLRSFRRQMIA